MEVLTTKREYFRKNQDEIDYKFTVIIESKFDLEEVKKKFEDSKSITLLKTV